jgi:hypothetical protein
MNADEFADAPGSDGTRFGRGFHRSNIATHEDRDVAIEEIFFANQNDVGRFYHSVGGLDSPDKTAGFYQSQRLVQVNSLLVRRVTYQKAYTKAIDRMKWQCPFVRK